jgi:hypothetical protein
MSKPAMGAPSIYRIPTRALVTALLTAAIGAVLPSAGAAQQAPRAPSGIECTRCHGELELLRQNVTTLTRARELLVTEAHIRGSAHDGMQCADCHSGYATFPHPQAARTSSCASCHTDTEAEWAAGQHARETVREEIAATCNACHGTHQMAPVAALQEGRGMEQLNARCSACHEMEALPQTDPHYGQVGCWTCHGAHAVHTKDDPAASISPLLQAQTCAVCHEEAAVNWRRDVHGSATLAHFSEHGGALGLAAGSETPVCTACHGGHGMLPVGTESFANESVAMCQHCHAGYTRTFFDSYHGKATALGSRVSAACYHCHGAHGVYPRDDLRSMVHDANLRETCETCHAEARPAFLLYDPHPNPFDRERNPWIFFAFIFMNTLLIGTLGVFGLHTVLWWVKLYRDKKKGILHGPHHHHSQHGGAGDAPHRREGTDQ